MDGSLGHSYPGRLSNKTRWVRLWGIGSFAVRMIGLAGFFTRHPCCVSEQSITRVNG